jgi:poly-gamma-glutamate capsule biosynthesis protein CapA/YwtB (metallophosphatase superfamily)
VSFTDNEGSSPATQANAGVFYAPIGRPDERTDRLFDVVRVAKGRMDFLVVAAHWGTNWGRIPPEEHTAFAHKLIDAGADLIFGHSPHVYRGIGIYRERPVLFSTGDFINDYAVSPVDRNDRSFLFLVELKKGQVHSLKLMPVLIRNCQSRIARGIEAEEMAASMMDLCAALGTPTAVDEQLCLNIHVK